MAENEDIKKDEAKESAEKPNSMLKWIIMGVLVVVLAGGGFAGWRIFFSADPAAEGEAQAVEYSAADQTAVAKGIICPLESFIVNLMDPSGHGKRYLKTTINLEVDDEEDQMLVKDNEAQLRDTILLLLSSQTYKEISSLEGKLTLKQALLVSINQLLGGNKIRRLYFTEFVVQ
jgi:flagellar FliL protein